jgi:small subunit ribosomal protein S2
MELAQKLVREVVARGENVLFVCTKRQLAAIVKADWRFWRRYQN